MEFRELKKKYLDLEVEVNDIWRSLWLRYENKKIKWARIKYEWYNFLGQ